MGREIRRVIPNWEHPMQTKFNPFTMKAETCYQPLYDHSYREAAAEWRKEFAEWEAGERQKYFEDNGEDYEYWDYNGMPPDKEYYRPDWKPEEMTWFQVYETVSEGTPVTPPFATKDELINYLIKNGDFWDQQRGDGGWLRENAEAFIERGFAMSLVVNTATGEVKAPRDGA